ncbi:uncharacterized protein LOC125039225 [Penaeus chinensis]|uniref:uncharacterized protein LOC125039225 n=1 Tax=Penaeus chinensis TaxID=139456 RepID=UPI001FB5CA4B|nr:uncharacterized protein LOC125039225 [Penaeus chinensis]
MGGYGGCSDSFSVFGFLAFLLALLDLILELQGNRRKKRDARGVEEDVNLKAECQSQDEIQQATSACYSLLRGFLNTLAAQDAECARRFLCEGAEEAASAGPVGEVIASVGSTNAGSWLEKVNSTLFQDVGLSWRSRCPVTWLRPPVLRMFRPPLRLPVSWGVPSPAPTLQLLSTSAPKPDGHCEGYSVLISSRRGLVHLSMICTLCVCLAVFENPLFVYRLQIAKVCFSSI